jgi:opacity protein-like surface antigen
MTAALARAARALLAAGVLAAAGAAPLAAQVGHEPGASPFRDLTTHQALTVSTGYFAGNAAQAGVGWRHGGVYAGRFDTRLGGPFDMYVSIGFAGSNRYKIDTTLDSASRTTGPFKRTLVVADLGLLINLTGSKTWRGFAPYLGFGAGEVFPTRSETDVGGYNAGANFSLIPLAGTRFFLGKTVAVRLEVRDYLFRYEWPLRYFSPLDGNGDAITPAILPSDAKERQWTHNLTFLVGVAYGFNF